MTGEVKARGAVSPVSAYEVWIPAYNAEHTIEHTIVSLLGQTVPPARLTVIDDGSSDQTVEHARSAGAEVVESEHRGLAGVQNSALEQVEAPFVAFVDSDDVWNRHYGEVLMDFWSHAAQMVGAVAANGVPITHLPSSGTNGVVDVAVSQPVDIKELWTRNVLTKSATCFRTAALRSIGGYRELPSAEDYDVLLRLIAAGAEVHRLDSDLVEVLVRTGSMTSKADPMLRGEYAALRGFYCSAFRSVELPDISLDKRARAMYMRALARCAVYGDDGSNVPPLRLIDPSIRGSRSLDRLLSSSRLRRFAIRAWAALRTVRTKR